MAQLQQARMKKASLSLTVSLCLAAVILSMSVVVGAADVWKLDTFELIVYCYSTATAWITNILGYNATTTNNESTIFLQNMLVNWTQSHANQIIQSAASYANQIIQSSASHAFTFSDKAVSYSKPVSEHCRCNDNSSCRRGRCVKVGNTCTIVYCYGVDTVWITSIVGIHFH